jgi:hypothetical protein
MGYKRGLCGLGSSLTNGRQENLDITAGDQLDKSYPVSSQIVSYQWDTFWNLKTYLRVHATGMLK